MAWAAAGGRSPCEPRTAQGRWRWEAGARDEWGREPAAQPGAAARWVGDPWRRRTMGRPTAAAHRGQGAWRRRWEEEEAPAIRVENDPTAVDP